MDLVITIDKPKGITSQQATSQVKRILRARKAGHTGTLDPDATGVLLVCVNRATRLASYFSSLNKQYAAVMKLGETTDTQDAAGRVISRTGPVLTDRAAIGETLKSFTGDIQQTPPMFSALKHRGRPLYTFARKGIDIPRPQRTVRIHEIELLDVDLPFVRISVTCSKGTYIRTLCDDIGKKLGTGAHLFVLKRTAIATFHVDNSFSLDALREAVSQRRGDPGFLRGLNGVYTMDEALSWMPQICIRHSQVKSIENGHPITASNAQDHFSEHIRTAAGIRIKSPDNRLLAVGSFEKTRNILKMDVVFTTHA